MKDDARILVVRTDRIGDVVLTTPALKALREYAPHAFIAVLVSPLTADLVKGNPYLDEVIIDERQRRHRGPCGFLRLIRTLKEKRFDIAINYHTKKRTNALCFLAGIPRRVGYHNKKWGFLLTDKIPDERHTGMKHERDYCLQVLAHLGIQTETPAVFVPLQKETETWFQEFKHRHAIREHDILVAVHPGASCPTKQWPAFRFVEVIEALTSRYRIRWVLIGAGQTKLIGTMMASLTRVPLIDAIGETTVAQLARLLSACRLLISNDSGPVHVADALGIPVIAIFTRDQPGINPQRWRPLGKQSRVIVTPFEGQLDFSTSRPVEVSYLALIQAKEVVEAVDALFKLC